MADSLSDVDGIMHALGEMSAAWGLYEDAMFILLADLMGGRGNLQVYHAIRGEMDMKRVTAIIKNLVLLSHDMKARDHALQLISWTDRPLREDRNRFIHDPLYPAHITGRPGLERSFFRVRVQKPQSFTEPKVSAAKNYVVTPEQLRHLTAAIVACESFCGRILFHIADDFSPVSLSELDASRARAAEAIASYTALTKSLESE